MTPAAAATIDEHELLNSERQVNYDATTTDDSDDCNRPLQTTTPTSSSTTTSSPVVNTNQPIQAASQQQRRRRQSLRSYLHHVSLSDSLPHHHDDDGNTPKGGGEVRNNTTSSLSKSSSGTNRQRRLEVMGLLQHLKVNRYSSEELPSSNTNGVTKSLSVGSLTDGTNNEEHVATTHPNGVHNNSNSTTCNTTTSSSTRSLPVERCLLHPTVRMRNDKCALCSALAKTLEVRKAKLEERGRVAAMESGGGASFGGDDDDTVGGVDDGGGSLNDGNTNKVGGGGGGSKEFGNDDITSEEEKVIIDTASVRLDEENAAYSTIGKLSCSDHNANASRELGILEGEQPQLNREEQPHLISVEQPEVAPVKTEGGTASIPPVTKRDNNVEAPPSTVMGKDKSHDEELDPQSASSTALTSDRLLDPNKKCKPVHSLSSMITETKALATFAEKNHNGNDNNGDCDLPIKDASSPLTKAPLTKLQKTIALAKGALHSRPRRQKRGIEQSLSAQVESYTVPLNDVSSPEKSERNKAVACRLSSCGSNESDPQVLPLEEVTVPNNSSDVSVKSTSDSSTLTSSTMGNNSLGGNSLGINSGSTHAPSRAIEDVGGGIDDSNSYSLSKGEKDTRTISLTKNDDADDSALTLDAGGKRCGRAFNTIVGGVGGEDGMKALSDHDVATGKSSPSIPGSDSKSKVVNQSADVIVEDVYSDSDYDDDDDDNVKSASSVQQRIQLSAASASNKQEGQIEDWINSVTSPASLASPKRRETEKGNSTAVQYPSPTSVVERGLHAPLLSEGGAIDSTSASHENNTGVCQDSFHTASISSTEAESKSSSSNKLQQQFSEVEKRLSRANQRLSRSITRRDVSTRRRTRSRSAESKIPFFAALVENARSRSTSRTRQRSRSRSVTRKGEGNTSKEGNDRRRSRSRSAKRNGAGENNGNKGEGERSRSKSTSRGRSVPRKDSENIGNNEFLSSRSGSATGIVEENVTVEGKKNAEESRSRSLEKVNDENGSTEANNLDTNATVSAKEEDVCFDEELIGSNSAASLKEEVSQSNQSFSDTGKELYLPHLYNMTLKALKAELEMYNVDYSSFCEKEQFITVVRQSRETYQRSQSEIAAMSLKVLRAELAIYEIDYSSFKEKSEFVVALTNAREKTETENSPQPMIASPPDEVTKELHLRANHREPITHPHYELGDVARKEDMIKFPKSSRTRSGRGRRRGQDNSETSSTDEDQDRLNQVKVLASMKELRHLDAAFIRRSDGRWTYALVADGDDKGIRFVLDKTGSTKTLSRELWKKNVRRIKVLTQRKGDVLKVADKPSRRKRDMRSSIIKRKKRTVSPSPTYYRGKLDITSLPPTITEEKVFIGTGIAPKLQAQGGFSQAGATAVLQRRSTWTHFRE